MIRWNYLLARIVVVIVILALLSFGLGPVAQYVTVRGFQQAVGAKVDIAETTVGLFPPRVLYTDVRVADPRDQKSLRDAISADKVELVIDGTALMQRRWVARSGKITGLRIGGRRTTSGHLPPSPAARPSTGPSMLDRIVSGVGDQISTAAGGVVDDLETVKRGKAIRVRWEDQYASLNTRAAQLEQKIRDISDRARGIDNPLRDWPEIERTLSEARAVREELVSVRQALNALPGQLQSDLVALDQAKQIDLEKVDQYVPGDLSQADDFGVEMIAQSVRQQVARVKSYLEGGKSIANYTVVAPEADRQLRGVDHDLNRQQIPNLLIRRCEISGVMRADGDVYSLAGVVENMTPTPEKLVDPTRARFSLDGQQSLRVEYVADRRDGADVDLLTLHWPEMEAEKMRLASSSSSALAVNGGRRELWIQIRTDQDHIDGRLVSKQTGVQMDLNVEPKYAQTAAVQTMRASLAAVDRVEIDATFAGTWENMDLDLNTNLGQILHRAGQDAIANQIRQSKEQLAAKVNQAHSQQATQLRQWLSQQSGRATTLLADADQAIEEMSRKVLTEAGDAEALLGSRLRSAVMEKLR